MNESVKTLLELDRNTQSSFCRPKPRKIWEWAEAKRKIAKSETAIPGRYKTSNAPYQREPQESFLDESVQTTVLYLAKRLGKSEMINNLHGSIMDENPMNILHVLPTLEKRNIWSKEFLTPLIESVESLVDKIMPARSRDSGNTIRSKRFPGGSIGGIGTNSDSGFKQIQAPCVTCDEVDAMEETKNGDPVLRAFGRSENYETSIQVVASTATKISAQQKTAEKKVHGGTGSRIHDWWLKSDKRKWFVKCPDCGGYHVMFWGDGKEKGGIKWPKKKLSDGVLEHQIELAYYECPDCLSKWDNSKRLKAVRNGEWRATAGFRGVRGYWLNGLNTPFAAKKGYKTKLHQFVAEFLDAKSTGEAGMTVWKNEFLCEPIEDSAEAIDPKPFMERRESYTPDKLPTKCVLIAFEIDVQGDRLEYDVIGMGENEETWAIEHRAIIGDPELDHVWKDLTSACSKVFKREDGVELKISCAAIDLGHKPKRVRAWIKSCGLPRVYGVYGTSGKQVNLVLPRHSKLYNSYSFAVNTDLAKEIIFARLKLKDMGQRYMHFGREEEGFDASYFDQLTAEEKRVRFLNGRPTYYFEKIRPRNEALDNRVYFLAAMDILRPNIKAMAENLLKSQPNAGGSKDYILKSPMEQSKAVTQPKPNTPQEPRKSRIIGGRGGAGGRMGVQSGVSLGGKFGSNYQKI